MQNVLIFHETFVHVNNENYSCIKIFSNIYMVERAAKGDSLYIRRKFLSDYGFN